MHLKGGGAMNVKEAGKYVGGNHGEQATTCSVSIPRRMRQSLFVNRCT